MKTKKELTKTVSKTVTASCRMYHLDDVKEPAQPQETRTIQELNTKTSNTFQIKFVVFIYSENQ